ncbi:hypothetical protein JAAARDRAFT_608559 [Jaapia argillacea MUCL 33604]|uniref:F-box domain-containing protein n=1 Tax=Jaapia argillacea MUCL 33604 TaxID=933084 RepID=A0A067QAI9_9AGAM|nr:hypothetical protein JAAARDRAFT_608559 [Jaapia argillacea MUCL 33604]
MAQVLYISEVYRKICRSIQLRGAQGVDVEWRGDLARLARCSRSLHEDAIDILWEELPEISCLLKLIPQCVEEGRSREYKLLRPPEGSDWQRFDLYGHRVRRLSHFVTQSAAQVCHQLWQHKRGPLLPKLQKLGWLSNGGADFMSFMSYLSSFLAPSLRHLEIEFPTLTRRTAQKYRLPPFFEDLPAICPNLTKVCLESLPTTTSLSFITRFEYLQILELDLSDWHFNGSPLVIDVPTLRGLGELLQLTRMKGIRLESGTSLHYAPFKPAFPSLTDLEVRSSYIQDADALLRVISSSSFQNFSTWMIHGGPANAYLHCLHTLSFKRDSLVRLEIYFGVEYDESEFTTVGEAIIQALSNLTLPNLELLHFSHRFSRLCSPLLIPTDAAAKMGFAWPRLTYFHAEDSMVTFSSESLSTFVSRYSRPVDIHLFDLVVTDRDVNVATTQPDSRIICLNLHTLRVQFMIHNTNERLLASALDFVFPNLDVASCVLGTSEALLAFLSESQSARKEDRHGLVSDLSRVQLT